MKLGHITGRESAVAEAGQSTTIAGDGRCLSLLIEGLARNMPEIEVSSYRSFRDHVSQLAMQVPDHLPEEDKLALIREVIAEFERYRDRTNEALRGQVASWRALTSTLLAGQMAQMGIDAGSGEAAQMVRRIASLLTGEEVNSFSIMLAEYFRMSNANNPNLAASSLKTVNRSETNDNASGLRGGGAAIEHVRRLMEQCKPGYAVLFRLGLLDVISERFGLDAVQDSLMAVSAFLTASLRNDDAIYHWSNSSLLAILTSSSNEHAINAAMRRIVDNNRDITVLIAGRSVMLRIPLEFKITSLGSLSTADDLCKLSYISEQQDEKKLR